MKSNLIIVILSVFLFCSCDMYSNIDEENIPGYEQKVEKTLFVQGVITSKLEYQFINLSTSFDLGELPDTVSNAVVKVTVGDSVYNFIESTLHNNIPENLQKSGLYVSENKISGKVGCVHTLSVCYKGENFFASDSMVSVSDFNFEGNVIPNIFNSMGNMKELVFGGIRFAQEESFIIEWEWFTFWGVDESGVVNKQKNAKSYYFTDYTSPNIASDSEGYLSEKAADPTIDSMVTATKMSISEEYSNYLIQTMNATLWNNSLFSPTPANVVSNVSNNGLGFFAACDVVSKEIPYLQLLDKAIKK